MFITPIETKVAPKIVKAVAKTEEKIAQAAKKAPEDLGNYFLRYDARNAVIKAPEINIPPVEYFSPTTPILK